MKKKLSLIIAIILLLTSTTVVYAELIDINKHWSEKEVNYMVDKGIINGYPEGTFRPEKNMSKVEFYKVINGLIGYVDKAKIQFDDVKDSDWFYEHIQKGVKAKYIDEIKALKPNTNITREEVAKILSIVFNVEEDLVKAKAFKDFNSISEDLRGVFGGLTQKGYLSGYPDGTVRPKGQIKRSEVVKMLYNISGEIANVPGTYNKDIKTNLIVSKKNVALKNMTIDGNLYLTEGIGEGTITLDNVIVKGELNIKGGGENSIIIKNSKLAKVVDKSGSKIRVVFENTTIENVQEALLNSEEKIRKYLEGEWVYDSHYRGDVICKMNIDKELNVSLSFDNSYSDEPKGNYLGKITFDRAYANKDEAPDLICIELIDTDEQGGDFFFLHRTIYNNKRVMSWFYAGNGNTVFDILDFTGDFKTTAEEIIFEKTTGERSQEEFRKNDEFYAVYWGTGSDKKSIWLDDVWWTPSEEDEHTQLYPQKMTSYKTDVAESILYKIAPDEIVEILGDDLTEGEIYFVKTDKGGNISYLIHAERKRWMEEGCLNPEDKTLIYNIVENDVEEIKKYLNAGMSILLTGETEIIENEECYIVILGTNHEENFVREMFYAVNTYTRQVYRFNVLNDRWEPVIMG